jgi:hypothetical protein
MTRNQIITWVIVILILIGAGIYYVTRPMVTATNPNDQVVACTMDARVCPDGSSVGRSGPNCEFAECPMVKGDATVDTTIYPADIYK